MHWTPERVELLIKMWEEGVAASTIAKELGKVTRNAVIGKANRLGLQHQFLVDASSQELEKPVSQTGNDGSGNNIANVASSRKRAQFQVISADKPLPPQPSANEISQEAIAKVREVEKFARNISLMELTERTCKWPLGDPATDSFSFCGLPAMAGKPYCEAHAGVAFQPANARRDRRK